MKLSNADSVILKCWEEEFKPKINPPMPVTLFEELKAQLHQALIAKMPSKKPEKELKGGRPAVLDALDGIQGYNQALDEVNKILKEFFL